ncbi:RNA-directed DNA polymerase from mobile element jockey [Trichonephila clavipes]|nr:RNA-directed DNA polymerase from mobile element jockey [Trichonephila clavipes]
MLTPKDHEPILIGSTYIPPINDYFRNLGAALDTIFNITNMTILVGDFNAKHTSWGCPVNDARGNSLYRYVVNSGIDIIAPPNPTRFGTASATIIDYALTKNLNWPCTIDSISELSSDHNPIKLIFPRTPSFEIPLPNFILTGKSSQIILQTMITCTFHRQPQPQRLSPKSKISLQTGRENYLCQREREREKEKNLEKENILVPEQHGFRPRLSTTHQLLRVVEYIKDGIDRHQYTAAVFLDIQEAFDRVWHTGLFFKLIIWDEKMDGDCKAKLAAGTVVEIEAYSLIPFLM